MYGKAKGSWFVCLSVCLFPTLSTYLQLPQGLVYSVAAESEIAGHWPFSKHFG